MALSKFSINLEKLEKAYLILIIYSLFFFSADGILIYGSMPTYLILLGLFVTILRSPKCLVLANFEQPFLLFLLCLALSVLFSVNTSQLSHIQSYLLMFLTYLYARTIRIPKDGFIYLIWVFSSFLVINLSLMLVQLVSGDLTFFIGRYDYLIPTGISSDQHMNGLLITISYAFIQSFFIRNGRNVIAPIFFVLCLFFLVINTSRASLFAYFVTTAYIAMMTLKLKHLISLGLMFGAIFLSVDIAWENLLLIASEILPAELSIAYNAAVMKYTAFFTDESVNERLTLWASLMDLSVVDSIKILTFGLGPGSFDSLHSQTIHNTLLDVLISVGAIGLFSIGIVIFRIVRYAAYRIDRNNCFALSAVIVSIVVSSMFHDFGRTRFLWIFLGLAACCCNRQGVLNSSNP